MPVSKDGKPYYTQEQYQRAKYENSNALEYALSKGYPLVKAGSYYRHAEHDSMIFTPAGMWFWNSRGVQGTALDFMIFYEGKTIVEAVLELAGEQNFSQAGERIGKQDRPAAKPLLPTAGNDFKLPEKAANYRQLFGYLCGTRHLPKETVIHMLRQNALYEGVFHTHSGREVHNAVFVYRDYEGNITGAYARGMDPKTPYKCDVLGSTKPFGWFLRGLGQKEDGSRLYVFEAAIDAASHLSCVPDAQAAVHLSLEGLNPVPLKNYLAAHPLIREIHLCLDADAPGQETAQKLRSQLEAHGYSVEIEPPPCGKDWNEALVLGYKTALEESCDLEEGGV